MQQKAHFLTAIPQVMTTRPAGHALVPPVMSRNSATGAAPARNSLSAKSTAMLTREPTTIRACLKVLNHAKMALA